MLKRLVLTIAIVLLIAGLVFGVIKIVPGDKTVEDAVSEVIDEIAPVDKIEDTEPETAVAYVDTTVVSMLDDINANDEMANTFWLNVKVAVSGYFGGLNDSGFYLISNDMNYAFESISCNTNSENNIELDTPITVYGEVVFVSGTEGYTINVDKVEVKD